MGRATCVYVYTSDETGACAHELARRIVAHVGEERVHVRVAMQGDGAGLVDALKRELAPLTIDVAHGVAESAVAGARRLMVEVSVAGVLSDATFQLHNVGKRIERSFDGGAGLVVTLTIEDADLEELNVPANRNEFLHNMASLLELPTAHLRIMSVITNTAESRLRADTGRSFPQGTGVDVKVQIKLEDSIESAERDQLAQKASSMTAVGAHLVTVREVGFAQGGAPMKHWPIIEYSDASALYRSVHVGTEIQPITLTTRHASKARIVELSVPTYMQVGPVQVWVDARYRLPDGTSGTWSEERAPTDHQWRGERGRHQWRSERHDRAGLAGGGPAEEVPIHRHRVERHRKRHGHGKHICVPRAHARASFF